jgi:mitosis inhibitor protein kinase SWE1
MVDASIHLNPQPQSNPKPHPLSFAESAFSTPSTASTPRPQNPRVQTILDTTQQTFYTPQNYKLVKPLQAAFMSEGLLSKRNRSNSTGPLPSSLHMPDTPCKRPLSGTFGIFPLEPTTPLPGHLRHQISFFDTDSNSSQETPGRPSHSYKSDYEFPATPTKSVDNQGSTPSALWRVHNLGKSPGGEEEVFSTGLEFPEMSPPKEHRRRSTTNGLLFQMTDLKGGRFGEKFEESEIMGTGEFSEVYEVVERGTGAKYAVKRTRFAMTGPKERYSPSFSHWFVNGADGRQRRLEEVRTLRDLGHHEHILELIDSWEQYDHLFIQTELCENGSLDVFLRDYGNIERLDEFRVWKILTELTHVPPTPLPSKHIY